MRHGEGGSGYRNLEKVQRLREILQRSVNHAAVVVELKEIFGVVTFVIGRHNIGDVNVQEWNCRLEYLRTETQQTEIGVDWRQLGVAQPDFFDSLCQNWNSQRDVCLATVQVVGETMIQLKDYGKRNVKDSNKRLKNLLTLIWC